MGNTENCDDYLSYRYSALLDNYSNAEKNKLKPKQTINFMDRFSSSKSDSSGSAFRSQSLHY